MILINICSLSKLLHKICGLHSIPRVHFNGLQNSLQQKTFFRTHCTNPHDTEIPCYLVVSNALYLRDAFWVPLTIYWHPCAFEKSSAFTCGKRIQNKPFLHHVLVLTSPQSMLFCKKSLLTNFYFIFCFKVMFYTCFITYINKHPIQALRITMAMKTIPGFL